MGRELFQNNKKISLKNKIFDSKYEIPKKDFTPYKCALNTTGCECNGSGVKLSVDGPWIKAELCSCVINCPVCFGSCRYSENNVIKSCKTPIPTLIVNIVNDANIPARYIDAQLDKFENFTGNAQTIIAQIMLWLDSFHKKLYQNLILSGPVGVGKTYILCALAKTLAFSGVDIKFVDFHQLLNVLRAGYAENTSDETILRPLIETQVLIIDELGKGRNNDWEQEKLDQLVMGRYNANKIIICSTNYNFKPSASNQYIFDFNFDQNLDIKSGSFNTDVFGSLEERIGKRIYSRLCEGALMLELEGEDFRKLISKNQSSLSYT